MAVSDCIDMPALGRPLSLGTLYDARSDSMISGLTLWKPEKLQTNVLVVPKPSATFKIFASNTVFDKLSSLTLSGDLKVSILGGLIDLGGSAKFLKESKCTAESTKVTLRYSKTSQIEHMTMSQLAKDQIDYPDLDFRMATHVVSAVTYGSEVYLEFEKEIGSKSQKKEAESFLEAQLKKVQGLALSTIVGPQWSTEEKINLEGLKCQFYGDIELEDVPTTYFESIEFFKRLPAKLKDEKGVPVEVTLYPLQALISGHPMSVRQLNDAYYLDVENILRLYVSLQSQCVDLIRFAGNILQTKNADTEICFKDIQEKLGWFKNSLTLHVSNLKRKFCKLITQIRSCNKTEEDLEATIEKANRSCFKPKRLETWLEEKKRELNSLKKYMTIMNGIRFVVQSDFDAALKDSEKDFSFVFVFSSLGRDETFLKRLDEASKLQRKTSNVQEAEPGERSRRWFTDPTTLRRVEDLANFFANFVKKNKTNERVSFFITPNKVSEYEGAVIELYKKEELVERSQFPAVTESPDVYRDKGGNLVVQWKPCKIFSDYIKGYNIYYRRFGTGEEGLLLRTVSAADVCTTFPNNVLRSWSGNYVYKVSPVFQFGEGPASNFNVPSTQQGFEVTKSFSSEEKN